jgi:hypothetical protein
MKGITKIFLGLSALVLIIILCGVLLVAASGFVKIPLLSSLLGTDKPRDLGVRTDSAYFQDMINKQGIQVDGSYDKYCLNCYITYSDMKPMDISVTSSELSSMIRATNDKEGTLKDVQVKLGDDNVMEMSANLDLKKYGYDYSGPIYTKGKIVKNGNALKIDLSTAEAGIIPVPAEYAQKGSTELENAINRQLTRMPGLNIEDFSVVNGALHYKGNFPANIRAG